MYNTVQVNIIIVCIHSFDLESFGRDSQSNACKQLHADMQSDLCQDDLENAVNLQDVSLAELTSMDEN